MAEKLLLTGANGFLGQAISSYLSNRFDITLLSRRSVDISIDLATTTPSFNKQYNLVVHAAGKAHSVPKTEAEAKEFFDVNLNGTKNLLKGLDEAPQLPQYFVFISSVSVYGLDTGHLINEDAPLLAQDPYGRSKIDAEDIVIQWCKKNNIIYSILRLPLLAGPNPPGNLGAMIKGISKGYYFNIGGGRAKKSIVLAEDVANIIPVVAKAGGIYNLTDRYHPSFNELSFRISKQLQKSPPVGIPMFVAKLLAVAGNLLSSKAPINSNKLKKITSDLTFNDDKAVKVLRWNPTPVLQGFKIK